MIQTLELTSLPPRIVITSPCFLPFSRLIFINVLNGKRGGGGETRNVSKNLYRVTSFPSRSFVCHAYTRNFDTRGFAINGINLFRVLDYSNETIENFFFYDLTVKRRFQTQNLQSRLDMYLYGTRTRTRSEERKLSRIKYPSTVSLDSRHRDPGEKFTRQVFPALFPETFRCLSNAASGQRITRYNSTRRVLIRPQRADTPVAMQEEGGGGGRWWLSVARSL